MRMLMMFLGVFSFLAAMAADPVDITVRWAPYTVGGASSKSVMSWGTCKYCGKRASNYERKFEWNSNKHAWVETTKKEDVSDVCRACQTLEKDQEKLDQKERKLDKQIESQRTRLRIKDKKQKLETLKKKAR